MEVSPPHLKVGALAGRLKPTRARANPRPGRADCHSGQSTSARATQKRFLTPSSASQRVRVPRRNGSCPLRLPDPFVSDAYRSFYRDLNDIRVDVRSPNGTILLAENVSPLEAIDVIEAWLHWQSGP